MKDMKTLFLLLIVTFASCLAYGVEPIASIESSELESIPLIVRSTIEADASFNIFRSLHCKIHGMIIPLSSKNAVSTWFVTTSDACGWGTALGPIWLVADRSGVNSSLLLATGGYSLSISGNPRRDFASITINTGTAQENISN
jgi:hypothetical protein